MLGRIITSLFSRFNSEFWLGPVNALVQIILRGAHWLAPDYNLTQLGVELSNYLIVAFPIAASRVLSKAIKPSAPATLGDATKAAGGFAAPGLLLMLAGLALGLRIAVGFLAPAGTLHDGPREVVTPAQIIVDDGAPFLVGP